MKTQKRISNSVIKTIEGGLATKLVNNLNEKKSINKDELFERCTLALESLSKSNQKMFQILVATFNSPIMKHRILNTYDNDLNEIPDENGKKLYDEIQLILNEK